MNTSIVRFEDIQMPRSWRSTFYPGVIVLLMITVGTLGSQGIIDHQEIAEFFLKGLFTIFLLIASQWIATSQTYSFWSQEQRLTIDRRTKKQIPEIFSGCVVCFSLSSFGAKAEIIGPRSLYWARIEVLSIGHGEIHVRLWDREGRTLNVTDPMEMFKIICRYNSAASY